MTEVRVRSRCFDPSAFPRLYSTSSIIARPTRPCRNCAFLGYCQEGVVNARFARADLVQAAITFGKSPHFYLAEDGASYLFERQYRVAIVRASLDSSGKQLKRSPAFGQFERTEKAFASFFLGMTASKLFADRYLDVPWLVHLDVFGPQLGGINSGPSNQRPDLLGQQRPWAAQANPRWVILEAKGRVEPCNQATLDGAKGQTRNVLYVGGSKPVLRVAACAYFDRKDVWHFIWQDPEEHDETDQESTAARIEFAVQTPEFLRAYYAPFLAIFNSDLPGKSIIEVRNRAFVTISMPAVDAILGIDAALLDLLRAGTLTEVPALLPHGTPNQPTARVPGLGLDGIYVQLGPSWEPGPGPSEIPAPLPLPSH